MSHRVAAELLLLLLSLLSPAAHSPGGAWLVAEVLVVLVVLVVVVCVGVAEPGSLPRDRKPRLTTFIKKKWLFADHLRPPAQVSDTHQWANREDVSL